VHTAKLFFHYAKPIQAAWVFRKASTSFVNSVCLFSLIAGVNKQGNLLFLELLGGRLQGKRMKKAKPQNT